MKSELEDEDFNKIIAEEELEQFLCYIGLRDELFNLFLSKGLNSIEKLLNLTQYNISKNFLNESKKELIIVNLKIVFDKINSIYCPNKEDANSENIIPENENEDIDNVTDLENDNLAYNNYQTKPSFLSIIRETFFDLKSSTILTKDLIIHSFKLKSKPNSFLPKDFKEENISADKLYASFLQDKRIGHIDNLEGFKNLRHLYLNNNKIQQLVKFNFPNLNILELSNNFIRKIENLELMTYLQNLNLEKNLICKLENINENFYLENLNIGRQFLTKYQKFEINTSTISNDNVLLSLSLEGCNLSDPSSLVIFKNLRKLKINNNKIYDLTLIIECLKTMTELENLFVNNNPFTETNKSFRDVIVIRCPKIEELDNKTVTKNEKSYVNSLYSRKYSLKGNINVHKNNFPKIEPLKTQFSLNVEVNKMNIIEEKKNLTFNRNKYNSNK